MIWLALLACSSEKPGAHGTEGTSEGAPYVDVLVVGAGPAGMAAALEAAAAGATVRLAEREATVGGSATGAGGLMIFCGTPEQAALGIADSPAALLAEWPTFTGGDAADPWVQRLASGAGPEVYDWLEGMGLRFSPQVTRDPSAGETPRVHQVMGGGEALVGVLAAAVEALPAGALALEAPVEALEVTEEGVTATVGGAPLRAGAVVVATGGLSASLERVIEARPDLVGLPVLVDAWHGADGSGFGLLEPLGAARENPTALGLYAHTLALPPDATRDAPVNFLPLTPWINAAGERFVDEATINDFRTGDARAAEGAAVWSLWDATVADPIPMREGDTTTRAAITWAEADTLPGLAAALGVPSAALEAEIAAFNAYAHGEASDDLRARPEALPVEVPPFSAGLVPVSAAKLFGGIAVDTHGQVLDGAGQPIPGVFAAGELTGMAGGSLVGDAGFTGSLTAVVLSGRVAGVSAAQAALR